MPFWHLFLKRKSLDLSAGVRLLKSNSMVKKSIPNWKLRVPQISKKLFKSTMTPTKAAFQPLFKKSTVQPVIFCNTSKTALQPLCKMSTVQQTYTIYFVTTKGSPPTSVQNIWSQVLQKKSIVQPEIFVKNLKSLSIYSSKFSNTYLDPNVNVLWCFETWKHEEVVVILKICIILMIYCSPFDNITI